MSGSKINLFSTTVETKLIFYGLFFTVEKISLFSMTCLMSSSKNILAAEIEFVFPVVQDV